jgi:hypothetical protein
MANGRRKLAVGKMRAGYFIDYHQKSHIQEEPYIDWVENHKYQIILSDKRRKEKKNIKFLDGRMSESIVNHNESRDD